jgi:HEAT repeat protein
MVSEEKDIRQLMEELIEDSEAIPFSRLYLLSDLARERWTAFQEVWQMLPTEQRRRLILALVDLAEASFHVNFDAIFRHCMQDPDPEVRAAAINGLWENEELTLIGPLLAALRSDPSAQVRAAAAMGLGRYVLAGELEQLEAPIQARITEELMTTVHLAGESVEVRRRAVESAAYACTPEVLDALEIAYDDQDVGMRLSAIVGMGRSCDLRWKNIILTELGNEAAAMRYEAALASGEMMLRAAVPILARLIDDTDPQVRDASIWALGQIGGQQARDVLLDAFEGADEDTAGAIEEALAEQALIEGEFDFPLYTVDPESAEDLLWLDNDDTDDLDEEWE